MTIEHPTLADPPPLAPDAAAGAGDGPRPPASRWRSWNVRRFQSGPWHVRHDLAEGGKSVTWRQPNGLPGLGDHALADLLYRGEALVTLRSGSVVVVTEGERAADAVLAVGIPAVGTVCGASSMPGPAVVSYLGRFSIVLWPDADEVGQRHMGRLGQALEAAGVTAVGVVRPPAGARRGWDAADADDTTVCELVADAMLRWIGPVT